MPRGCCPKWDRRTQLEYNAMVEAGKIGNQLGQVSTFHARNVAMQRALRETVRSGDMNRNLNIRYK